MSILPHVVAGAVAGSLTENPFIAFLTGSLTHLLLDYIPHYDPQVGKKAKPSAGKKKFHKIILWIDLLTSLVLLILFLPSPNLFWGGIGGAIPDLDNFLQYRYPVFPLLSRIGIPVHDEGTSWHNKLHFKSEFINLILGIIVQTIVVVSGIWFINHFDRHFILFRQIEAYLRSIH